MIEMEVGVDDRLVSIAAPWTNAFKSDDTLE